MLILWSVLNKMFMQPELNAPETSCVMCHVNQRPPPVRRVRCGDSHFLVSAVTLRFFYRQSLIHCDRCWGEGLGKKKELLYQYIQQCFDKNAFLQLPQAESSFDWAQAGWGRRGPKCRTYTQGVWLEGRGGDEDGGGGDVQGFSR